MSTIIKNILVIRLGRIGDMVLSRPLLAHLKEELDNVKIDVLASADNHKVIANDKFVDEIIVWDKNPLKAIPTLLKLRSRKYDILLEPKDHFSQESQIITSVVNANKSIGFKRDKNSVFEIHVDDYNSEFAHFQDRILSTVSALGIKPNYEKRYPLPYQNKTKIENDFFLFNIAASSLSKSIGYELGVKILDELKKQNATVKLITAPNNKETAQKLANNSGYELLTTKSIEDTYKYINKCKGLVTADTSLVHIAGTYDTPVLVFSKSIERELVKFAPKSSVSIVVKSDSSDYVDVSVDNIKSAIYKFIKQSSAQ